MNIRLAISVSAFLLASVPQIASARPVKFVFIPDSATGQYAPVHIVLKCKAGGTADIWNSCLQYDVQHKETLELKGDYCIQVRWEDGKTYRGSFQTGNGKTPKILKFKPSNLPPTGSCQ